MKSNFNLFLGETSARDVFTAVAVSGWSNDMLCKLTNKSAKDSAQSVAAGILRAITATNVGVQHSNVAVSILSAPV